MVVSQLLTSCRRRGREAYFRLTAMNYRRELYARQNRTAGGTFRCYDLLNRHGDDPMLADMARECDESAVVYDVGANVGIYALSLAVNCPDRTIVAIEPAPEAVEHLSKNVAANGLRDRIEILNAGLGASTGKGEFYVSTVPELSGFDRESATRWGADVARTVEVSVETLDSVARTRSDPDVIKLDVEGAGPAVLDGGTTTLEESRPMLYVEVHGEELGGDHGTRMRTHLAEHGYQIEDRDGYWRCTPE